MAQRTILFVDDSRDILTVMTIGLEHLGFKIFTAWDLASAYAVLDHHPVDMIILDNGLPDIEGVDLGAQILQTPGRGDLPLVLFTGTCNSELEARARSHGFVDCWVKPMGFKAIAQKIETLMKAR